jgi:divalent metal cation (Fe/Co/Zn/Cd) transporter
MAAETENLPLWIEERKRSLAQERTGPGSTFDPLAIRTDRAQLLRRGLVLEYFTVGWNAVEALVGIAAGIVAGSIALLGFGLDSIIESLSGLILIWRLRKGNAGSEAEESRAETVALRLVGLSFLILAAYILYNAGGMLLRAEAPAASPVGIGLAVVSLILMPILASRKKRLGAMIGSRALQADALETYVCAWLSFALLLGLILNAAIGWWWADPVAALLMTWILIREGIEAIRGDDD